MPRMSIHPDPIARVINRSHGDTPLLPADEADVRDCLILALHLLLHPGVLPQVANLIGGNYDQVSNSTTSPEVERYKVLIQDVVVSSRWFIVIDDLPRSTAVRVKHEFSGWHGAHGKGRIDFEDFAIHMNHWVRIIYSQISLSPSRS